jgi:multiple antibiotic resistance protein
MNELEFFGSTLLALFVIIDPFAVVPVYISLTQRFTREETIPIRRKATLIAFIMLFTFAVTGLSVFRVFGITLPAFRIAGGIMLFSFGLSQLSQTRQRVTKSEQEESLEKEDISVFPLATPLLAGPGAISTIVLFSSEAQTSFRHFLIILALTLVLAVTYYLLYLAPYIYRVLGKTGLNLITRIMGIILCSIAVQFIIEGLKQAFFS